MYATERRFFVSDIPLAAPFIHFLQSAENG